jgi:diguanylate cyclase (GGDEF)-like protein
MAEYERGGATAEIAELAGEYGRMLEELGDYRRALALHHRQRALLDEIALESRQRVVLELHEKYEAEKRRREIDLLARENDVKTAALENQALRQRIGAIVAAVLALSFTIVAVLYRKLRASTRLLARTNEELVAQSARDPLTGLANRRHFQRLIDDEQGRRAEDATPRALLIIDLDHFKETNDRHGHARGDAVLVAVAERLRATLRESDTIVRWGGEEFLVIAKAAPDGVDEIAARVLRAIAGEPVVRDGRAIVTTASIGYAPMPLPPATAPLPWDRAIGLVDMALYLAKANGRNRAFGIERLKDGDDATLAAVERDLARAVDTGLAELRVVYGPAPGGAGVSAASPARAPARARASG